MSYDKALIAKAINISREKMGGMDTSKYIGPSGYGSKQEVEAAFLLPLLIRTMGLDTETLVEIVRDQYGFSDKTIRQMVKLAEEKFR